MNKGFLTRPFAVLVALLLIVQPVLAEVVVDTGSAPEEDAVIEAASIEEAVEVCEELTLSEAVVDAAEGPEAIVEDAPEAIVEDTPDAIVEDAPEAIVEETGEDEAAVGETEDATLPELPAENVPEPEAAEVPEITEAPEIIEVPEADKAFEAAAADPGVRSFSQTVAAKGETWKDVNLTRAAGFTGKLAKVSGTLTLQNVKINGVSAGEVNLLDWFDLDLGASIAVTDAAPLRLNLSALSINKGSKHRLQAFYNGSAIKASKVKWSSSAKKLASVSKKGTIKAKQQGMVVITASYKGAKALCRLDVTGLVYPKSVKLKKKATLGLNTLTALKATIKPANANDKTLTWVSSNPQVATVDARGNVAALTAGKAYITAVTVNGKKASCKVTVKAIKAKSLDFKKLYVTLHPGESYQAAITVKPSNTSYPGAKYTSSDTAVATVDETGKITAVGTGTATITAVSTYSAKIRNTCKVCVIEKGAPQLAGLIIGINPGHQRTTIQKRYPLAPGRHSYAPGVKVGAGGCSTGQPEFKVVLAIGLKLKRILEEHGAKVVITRTTNDVMLTNIDRAKMLNEAGVDVALQLHNNSCSNAGKSGQSAYIRTTGDWFAESKALAKSLTKCITRTTGFKNLGTVYYNDFMSLNWTTTPSVLLEMGYLSNSSDDHKLAQDSFREKLAQGIYLGLCEYFGR